MNIVTSAAYVLVLFVPLGSGQFNAYHGILINGASGTQIYDPFNSPHTIGNLQIELQTPTNSFWSAAVMCTNLLAYFGGDGE
jgi:hypothetical protein